MPTGPATKITPALHHYAAPGHRPTPCAVTVAFGSGFLIGFQFNIPSSKLRRALVTSPDDPVLASAPQHIPGQHHPATELPTPNPDEPGKKTSRAPPLHAGPHGRADRVSSRQGPQRPGLVGRLSHAPRAALVPLQRRPGRSALVLPLPRRCLPHTRRAAGRGARPGGCGDPSARARCRRKWRGGATSRRVAC